MKTIQLLIEDDYLETFLKTLPLDKVKIIDQTFIDDRNSLHEELNNFLNNKGNVISYQETMAEMNNWLKKKEK